MGPPGSGKGTQSGRIADKLGITRAASGDLFRQHQQRNTELGRLARSYMERGEYVPDDVTITMVMEWVNGPEQSEGFVLDGFPRTLPQAQALDRELEDTGGIDLVLNVAVPEEELVRRISGRVVCDGCQTPYHLKSSPPAEAGKCDRCGGALQQRADDNPDVVRRRIQVYNQETGPVVKHYQKASKLRQVDGQGQIEEVGQALVAAVS